MNKDNIDFSKYIEWSEEVGKQFISSLQESMATETIGDKEKLETLNNAVIVMPTLSDNFFHDHELMLSEDEHEATKFLHIVRHEVIKQYAKVARIVLQAVEQVDLA
jgi:hypothetical protein